jgi:hypothetical protein
MIAVSERNNELSSSCVKAAEYMPARFTIRGLIGQILEAEETLAIACGDSTQAK